MSGEPKAASTETWQRKIINQNKLNEISISLYDLFKIYSVINLKTNLSRNRPLRNRPFSKPKFSEIIVKDLSPRLSNRFMI